ncbi:MAG: hypothetical protein FJ146_06150 [Deltaproteobacteria bacterium]|nr:hypothetical protein [Deltaproteobacteria bacterium]
MNTHNPKSLLIASVSIFTAVSIAAACGSMSKKDGGVSAASNSGDGSETSSYTAPGVLTLGSTEVAYAAGALAEGTKLKTATADDPSEFGIVGDIGGSSASASVSVLATGADGTDVGETNSPLTLAIHVPETLDLTALATNVPKVYDNLCAVAKARNGTLRVWRRSSMTMDTKIVGRFKFKTKWLGVYKMYFCGAMPIANAALANDAGTDSSAYVDGAPIASCKVTQADGYSACEVYTGIAFGDNRLLDSYKAKCGEKSGTFSTAACSDSGTLGSCVNAKGKTMERATIYAAPTPAPADSVVAAAKTVFKNACLEVPTNIWNEAGALAATPMGEQQN